jgi:hypothetical protein
MQSKVDKILECYRRLKEEMGAGAAGGGMTTQSSPGKPGFSGAADAKGPVAGYDAPVDFRKRKYKKLNMFYRQSVKPAKGAKNARKGPG